MILSALPFVRYVQIVGGHTGPFLRDRQIRTFLGIIAVVVVLLVLWRWQTGAPGEPGFREALFNTVSVVTGTGFANADYGGWGAFPVALIFFTGLVGGCSGSTACSVKVFRYQLLFASLRAQIRRIHAPSGIFVPRFEGRPVSDEVLNSVMVFFVTFVLMLGLFSVALGLTGLDFITSVSGAATALANIGPGLGPIIGPAGNFATLSDTAKWLTYWAGQGCAVLQPYDMEVGAGTFHPATTLRALGPRLGCGLRPALAPPDRRALWREPQPAAALLPVPGAHQTQPAGPAGALSRQLEAIGIDMALHDIRFVEDDWESPTLGAWGLGWEVWCDGMEVSAVHLFPAGRRARLPPRFGRADLRAGAAGDVCAGRRSRHGHAVQRSRGAASR